MHYTTPSSPFSALTTCEYRQIDLRVFPGELAERLAAGQPDSLKTRDKFKLTMLRYVIQRPSNKTRCSFHSKNRTTDLQVAISKTRCRRSTTGTILTLNARTANQLVIITQSSMGFCCASAVLFPGAWLCIAVILVIEAGLRFGTSILGDSFVYSAVNFIDWRIFVRHKNARTRNLQ